MTGQGKLVKPFPEGRGTNYAGSVRFTTGRSCASTAGAGPETPRHGQARARPSGEPRTRQGGASARGRRPERRGGGAPSPPGVLAPGAGEGESRPAKQAPLF